MKTLYTSLMVAVLMAAATSAHADTTARIANALAVEQLFDSIQTTAAIRAQRCHTFRDPALPIGRTTCSSVFVEEDPFARPFVHSVVLDVTAAAALNFGLRSIMRHVPATRSGISIGVGLYPLLLIHNANAARATITVRF